MGLISAGSKLWYLDATNPVDLSSYLLSREHSTQSRTIKYTPEGADRVRSVFDAEGIEDTLTLSLILDPDVVPSPLGQRAGGSPAPLMYAAKDAPLAQAILIQDYKVFNTTHQHAAGELQQVNVVCDLTAGRAALYGTLISVEQGTNWAAASIGNGGTHATAGKHVNVATEQAARGWLPAGIGLRLAGFINASTIGSDVARFGGTFLDSNESNSFVSPRFSNRVPEHSFLRAAGKVGFNRLWGTTAGSGNSRIGNWVELRYVRTGDSDGGSNTRVVYDAAVGLFDDTGNYNFYTG